MEEAGAMVADRDLGGGGEEFWLRSPRGSGRLYCMLGRILLRLPRGRME